MREIIHIPDINALPKEQLDKIHEFIRFYSEKIASNVSKVIPPENKHESETHKWKNEPSWVFLVTNIRERIIALLHYHKWKWEDGTEYLFHTIVIEPNYVGKWVWTFLMGRYIDEVLGDRVALCIINEANHPSIQFHGKFGFEKYWPQIEALYPEYRESTESLRMYWYFLDKDSRNS